MFLRFSKPDDKKPNQPSAYGVGLPPKLTTKQPRKAEKQQPR